MGGQWDGPVRSFPRFVACTNVNLWAARGGESAGDLVTIEAAGTQHKMKSEVPFDSQNSPYSPQLGSQNEVIYGPKYVRYCRLTEGDFKTEMRNTLTENLNEAKSRVNEESENLVSPTNRLQRLSTGLCEVLQEEEKLAGQLAEAEHSKQYKIHLPNAEWIDTADMITNSAAKLNTGPAEGATRGMFEQSSTDAVFGFGFGRYVNLRERFSDTCWVLWIEAAWFAVCALPCVVAGLKTTETNGPHEAWSLLFLVVFLWGSVLALQPQPTHQQAQNLRDKVQYGFRHFHIARFSTSLLSEVETTESGPVGNAVKIKAGGYVGFKRAEDQGDSCCEK